MNIKIIIAEDHPILRDGLRTMLNLYPNFEIIAEVEDGSELLKVLKNIKRYKNKILLGIVLFLSLKIYLLFFDILYLDSLNSFYNLNKSS